MANMIGGRIRTEGDGAGATGIPDGLSDRRVVVGALPALR